MKIRLSGLPEWVTVDDIRAWLAASELVADEVSMISDPVTQYPSGACLIDAVNEDEGKAIMRRFDAAPLEDALLKCVPAGKCETPRPRFESLDGTTVFVAGFPQFVTEGNLRHILDTSGISYFDVKMPTHPDGTSRRIAFIQTAEPKKMVAEFDGQPFRGRRLIANIAKSQRRDFIRDFIRPEDRPEPKKEFSPCR